MGKNLIVGMGVLLVLVGVVAMAAEEQPKQENLERRYQLGPLVAEDFRGSPPPGNAGKGNDYAAGIETTVRWTVRYRIDQTGKKFTIKLTEVDVFAAVYPYKSFNNRPIDKALLDHEQGHFDIAEIFAREMRIKLTEEIRRGKPLTVSGTTQKEASEQVDVELNRLLKDARESLSQRHEQYDAITNHGDNPEKQKLQRDEQKEKLKSLQQKIDGLLGKRK
jgi:hypothetical protein